jgi:hypothetical protein
VTARRARLHRRARRLPKLEDFWGSPRKNRTVYGGLAVALPFIHTPPRYFAQIIGELLYLMVAVTSVDVWLTDHLAAEEINAAARLTGRCDPRGRAVVTGADVVGAALGLDYSSESPLLVDDRGEGDPSRGCAAAAAVRAVGPVCIEGNAGLCRALSHTRHPEAIGN